MTAGPCGAPRASGELSALQHNISVNGTQSYYYAHKARETGEARAPDPVHQVLETTQVQRSEAVETIFNYQFLDEGDKVKVYIPLEGVGALITDDDVACDFQARSLEVCVRGYREGRVLRLCVRELSGNVDPSACKFRRLANKVAITLQKADAAAAPWSRLSAK